MGGKKNQATVKEITDLLKACKIELFVLDAHQKKLTVQYKQDSHALFRKMKKEYNIEPRRLNPDSHLPYGARHFAYIQNFKGWYIEGNVILDKPK